MSAAEPSQGASAPSGGSVAAQAQPLRLAPLQRAILQEMGVEAALLRPYALPLTRAAKPPVVAQAAAVPPRLIPVTPKPAAPPAAAPKSATVAVAAGEIAPRAHAAKLVCQCYGAPSLPTWLVVGEAPRLAADTPATLAQGRAAQLLDAMLAAVRLQPLGAAQPWTPEIASVACVLALGRVAAAAVLDTSDTLDQLRGQVRSCTGAAGAAIPVVVTHPPGWLLSHARDKAQVWRDLLLAQDAASGV